MISKALRINFELYYTCISNGNNRMKYGLVQAHEEFKIILLYFPLLIFSISRIFQI